MEGGVHGGNGSLRARDGGERREGRSLALITSPTAVSYQLFIYEWKKNDIQHPGHRQR